MRKINFLKAVLGVAVATLLTTGAFGQVNFVNDSYSRYDSDVNAPDTVDYVTLKTGGTTMGYYAKPDPVYHPNYTQAGTWALTPLFTWNWSVVPAMTIAKPGVANYATINYTATGNYVVNVVETAPAAFGGCADATPTVMNVTVINPPSAGFSTVDDTICGDFAAQTIVMNIVENAPANWASWAFAVVRVTENVNAAGQRIGLALDSTTVNDFTLAAKGRRPTTAGFGGVQPNYTYTITTPALTIQNSLRTRYSYRLYTATGATGTGIVSAISQKSDFLVSPTVNAYAFTDAQVVFTANPAPVTGPIYHIPNQFAY
jgi:hypothetical protein